MWLALAGSPAGDALWCMDGAEIDDGLPMADNRLKAMLKRCRSRRNHYFDELDKLVKFVEFVEFVVVGVVEINK